MLTPDSISAASDEPTGAVTADPPRTPDSKSTQRTPPRLPDIGAATEVDNLNRAVLLCLTTDTGQPLLSRFAHSFFSFHFLLFICWFFVEHGRLDLCIWVGRLCTSSSPPALATAYSHSLPEWSKTSLRRCRIPGREIQSCWQQLCFEFSRSGLCHSNLTQKTAVWWDELDLFLLSLFPCPGFLSVFLFLQNSSVWYAHFNITSTSNRNRYSGCTGTHPRCASCWSAGLCQALQPRRHPLHSMLLPKLYLHSCLG